MSEGFLCKWWEPILASVSEFQRKNYDGWIQDGQIQDGRIQDGCHHQFEWEWISLSQIKLVWIRVRVKWECFEWIWEKKTRCLNPTWQNSRWLPSSSWVRMNEWSFICANGGEGSGSEVFFVQMVGTNLGKCEWVWEEKLRWLNPKWQNLRRWLPSISWVRMNKFESDWISLSQSFVQNGWIQDDRIQDGRIQDGCHHQVNQIELVWVRLN